MKGYEYLRGIKIQMYPIRVNLRAALTKRDIFLKYATGTTAVVPGYYFLTVRPG